MSLHEHHAPGGIDDLLEEAHLAIALIAGTLVASPVIVAALSGRQEVPIALAMYLAALAGSWIVVGLVGGALSMAGRTRAPEVGAPAPAPSRVAPVEAVGLADADAVTDPDPVITSR